MTDIEHLTHELCKWREQSKHQHKEIMSALSDLTDSVTGLAKAATDLTGAVDAAVTDIQNLGPTDTQIAAQTQAINGVVTALQAQTARLNAAVNPPATSTPTTPAPAPGT